MECLSKVRMFGISISDILPYVDYHRLIYHFFHTKPIIENKTMNVIVIDSHKYRISKLESPYTDQCFDYTNIGFFNQRDAITNCYNNLSYNEILNYIAIQKSDKRFMNSIAVDDSNITILNICENRYYKQDCIKNITFTRSTMEKTNYIKPGLAFQNKDSQDPSFTITSKVKIDLIDYISFVLGVISSWLGISAISLNPIPHLFRFNDQEDDTFDEKLREKSPDVHTKLSIMRIKKELNDIKCILQQNEIRKK